MSAPTAGWPAPLLVGALARANWGALDGRALGGCRAVVRALVDLLPHRAAAGKLTAAQVADAAGLSVRWTRHCLHVLESFGLVTWSRGWLDRGRPRPGWIRLDKAAVLDLLLAARGDGSADRRRQERRDALAGRLGNLRRSTIRTMRRHKPLSPRPELGSTPPPSREEPGRLERPPAVFCLVCARLNGPHRVAIALGNAPAHPWTPGGAP